MRHLRTAAAAAMFSLPVLAVAADTSAPAYGEIDAAPPVSHSDLSRAEVLGALQSWRLNPAASDGAREIGGEIGWLEPVLAGRFTRTEVRQDLAAFQQTHVVAEGWRHVDGELGWVFEPGPDRPSVRTPGPAPSLTREGTTPRRVPSAFDRRGGR